MGKKRDLHFNSDDKFGSFILHAAVDFENFTEDAVFMLSSSSSVSESFMSESSSSSAGYVSWFSKSFGLWSTGFNGICGECDSRFGSGGSGWRWSTNDGRCCSCRKWNNISGRELSNNDDDQQQQQQQLVLKLSNLGFPPCSHFGKPPIVMVVGSCNGIICLYDEQSNEVSFWNPATRQVRILPKPSSSITIDIAAAGDGNVRRLFAFGFDEETKDYKVVLLSVSNQRMLDFVIKDEPAAPMKCICHVEVYSSSTKYWKPFKKGITCLPGSPFPYPPDSSSLFYLNGCCFFLAKLLYSSSSKEEELLYSEEEEEEEEEQCIPPRKPGDRFMISLDLTNESITPIKLSEHHQTSHLYLCYLGKKLALFSKILDYYREGGSEDFLIYVFNEHRRKTAFGTPWAFFRSFRIQHGLPGERNIPRGISNDGVFVLLETEIPGGLGNKKNKKKMKLYNLVTGEVKKNFLSCDQVLSKAFPYEPSLVTLDMVIGKAAECGNQPMITD